MNVSRNTGVFVQYGCGTCCPSEWRNFDVSPALRLRKIPILGAVASRLSGRFPRNAEFGDIVKGLPLAEGCVDAIYCSHVLEHLWPDECAIALRNTYRYLRSDGVFRLVVPDVLALARGFVDDARAEAGLDFMSSLHVSDRCRPRGVIPVLRYAFGRSQHRWMWESRGLGKYLQAAGFARIRVASLGDSEIKAFASVEDPERFRYALCMEARK